MTPHARALVFVLSLGSALAGCEPEVVEEPPPPPCADTDDDGLSDCEERDTYGTSPVLADTDGDGFSDHRELVELGFHAENNNYKFNPLIADVPKIGIELTSTPAIGLLYDDNQNVEQTVTVDRTSTFSTSQTSANSTSNGLAVEIGHTTGSSVSAGASVGFGGVEASAEVTTSYESSYSTTSERTFTWSSEQSQENSDSLSQAEGLARSAGTSVHGGYLAVPVNVVNEGDISFTVKNLTLGAVLIDPGSSAILAPIANLNFDTTFAQFPEFTLGPNGASSNLTFINTGLDTATAQALLASSSGLTLSVASYELTDENGRALNHHLTEIGAKTASVILDYAGKGGHRTERYLVATNSDPDLLKIDAKRALESILKVPYQLDDTGGLAGVRDVGSDVANRRFWKVLHLTTDGVDKSVTVFDPAAPYAFDEISLKSGDVLHLIYMEDEDDDGLGRRQEIAFGSSDASTDSDTDGILDGDEVFTYHLHPARFDSDGDGIRDPADVITAVAAGDNHSLALALDGTLWAWGSGEVGQLGTPSGLESCTIGGCASTKRFVGSDFVQISAGGAHSAGIKSDGTLWMWGLADSGQLGEGYNPGVNVSTPDPLGADTDWAMVAAGQAHTVALKTDGTLWTWGNNKYEQLGRTSSDTCNYGDPCGATPAQVGTDTDWVSVSAGGHVSMALKADGTLWAFGRNNYGQLGQGDFGTNVGTPVEVGSGGWQQVSVNQYHALAVKADGTLWSWGRGSAGQLGHDATEECAVACSTTPGQVGSTSDWSAVDAGRTFSVARKADGTLWSWGSNGNGQLGLGDTSERSSPVQVGPATDWKSVTVGSDHVIGLKTWGTVWSWGANFDGELGLGDTDERSTPTAQP